MSDLQIDSVPTGDRIRIPCPPQYSPRSLSTLLASLSERLHIPSDQLLLLTFDGRLLTPRKLLPMSGSQLTLLTTRIPFDGIVPPHSDPPPPPASLPHPISNIEKGLYDKQERLYGIAKRAQAVSIVLKAHTSLRDHSLMVLKAAEIVLNHKRGFVEKERKRASALFTTISQQSDSAKSTLSSLRTEVLRLKSIPLHPSLVLEDRKTLGDLYEMLRVGACEETLAQTLTEISEKAEMIKAEKLLMAGTAALDLPSTRLDDLGCESELQKAEAIISAYVAFRTALEARKPLEGGLPQVDLMYESVTRLETMQPIVARKVDELKGEFGRAVGYLQECMRDNIDTVKKVKGGVKAQMRLLTGLMARAQQMIEYLGNGVRLEAAYDHMVMEVTRRRGFAEVSLDLRKQLVDAIEEETKLREEFCEKYGKILPKAFIPQLSEAPDSIFLYPPHDNDQSLPILSPPSPLPALSSAPPPRSSDRDTISQLQDELQTAQKTINQLHEELQETVLRFKDYQKSNEHTLSQTASLTADLTRERLENASLISTRLDLELKVQQLQSDIQKERTYSRSISTDLHSLRKVNEDINNEKVMQMKEIVELKMKLNKVFEESAMAESMKLQADASTSDLRAKIDQLRLTNLKLRKKLQSTLHFTDFPTNSLALFFPTGSGVFAAFHSGPGLYFLDPDITQKRGDLR